jgi:hypothetical protein
MKEQSVTDEDFIKAPHTGEWFLGKNVRQFLTYLEKDQPRFVISEQFDPHYSSFASQQVQTRYYSNLIRSLKYESRYFACLFDCFLWGYGERSSRVIRFALLLRLIMSILVDRSLRKNRNKC